MKVKTTKRMQPDKGTRLLALEKAMRERTEALDKLWLDRIAEDTAESIEEAVK